MSRSNKNSGKGEEKRKCGSGRWIRGNKRDIRNKNLKRKGKAYPVLLLFSFYRQAKQNTERKRKTESSVLFCSVLLKFLLSYDDDDEEEIEYHVLAEACTRAMHHPFDGSMHTYTYNTYIHAYIHNIA